MKVNLLFWFIVSLIVVVVVAHLAQQLLPDYWLLISVGAWIAMLPISYHGGA